MTTETTLTEESDISENNAEKSAETSTDSDSPFAAQIAEILQLRDTLDEDPAQTKAYIARALNETDEKPLAQLDQIIEAVGTKKALKMLVKAFRVEANGGMMIYNNTRRRTIGGVYFFLAQRWIKPQLRPIIWPELFPGHAMITWPERIDLIKDALKDIGQANIPRLILMGRPGKVIEKGKVVLTTMNPKPQPKTMPRGLPAIPEDPATPYILYVGAKQWRKVKDALNNKEDELIVEGYPAFNPQLKAMTVFATKTTTRQLEEARRVKQRADMTPAAS